jgi:sugar lactone lactonase YvrE
MLPSGRFGRLINMRILACLPLVFALAFSSSAQQRSIFDISRDGAKAYGEKDYAEYLRLMQEAYSIAPNNPGVIWALARGNARLEKKDEAIKLLERLLAMEASYDVAASPDLEALRKTGALDSLIARFAKLKERVGTSEPAFRVPEPGINPESIAYDPKDKGFFIGSSKRKVGKWLSNGTIRDFGDTARSGLWMVLGIKLDAKRRVLWVNSCSLGEGGTMTPPEPESTGSGGIFRFHADTGKLLSKEIIGTKEKPGCVNDLAIDASGNAYVTHGPPVGSGTILRVDGKTGTSETFYTPDGNFLGNGIALSANGKTLYVADSVRGVLAIDVPSRKGKLLAMPENVAMVTIDGLYVFKNSLVAIQNHPALTRVARFTLNKRGDSVLSAQTLERNHPAFSKGGVPTTGVIVGDSLYFVANTILRDPKPGEKAEEPEPVILKVNLGK